MKHYVIETLLNWKKEIILGWKPTHLVVAVELPTKAIELIHNTTNIESKIDYYLNAYNEEARLKANNEIRICEMLCV